MAEVMLAIRREDGPAVVAERLMPKMESSPSHVIVVEGVRSMAEVWALRNHHSVTILCVHASPRTRYERLRARGRIDDPKNWEEFSERDSRELSVGIGDVIALSDEVLINENEETALEAASEDVLSRVTRK
jgi:dephospho-CoA kinase